MKKLTFFFLTILLYFNVNAQGSITNISCSPANPNVNDTIYFFVETQFPSSDCLLMTSNFSINGNSIIASAQHCLGMLSAICNTTDTFMILPLSVGTYIFNMTLSSGFGGPPCTAGIVPDDNQLFTFTVSSAQSPCALTGGSVYIDHNSSPWMMNATVNGMSQYSYTWTSGAAANQTLFYSQWCVTIVDLATGCDTMICESCIPDTMAVCPCPMTYIPVCGCDGNMYANDCIAICAGIYSFTSAIPSGIPGGFLPCTQQNPCIDSSLIIPGILCPTIYDPVCGCDSITYSNDCQAQNWYGVTSWTQGPCSTLPPCSVEINNGAVNIEMCDGDTVILEATTGFDTYLWTITGPAIGTTRTITTTIPGIYTVVATDSLCADIDSIEVILYQSPQLSIGSVPSPATICLGDSVVLEASPGFVSYFWNLYHPVWGWNLFAIDSLTVFDSPTVDTWYRLDAVDSNGCVQEVDITVYVDTCITSINNSLAKQIAIYPNPTSGKTNIDLPKDLQFDILLYEVNGRLINSWLEISDQFTIDEKISKGIYLVEIKNKNNRNYFKLIKR